MINTALRSARSAMNLATAAVYTAIFIGLNILLILVLIVGAILYFLDQIMFTAVRLFRFATRSRIARNLAAFGVLCLVALVALSYTSFGATGDLLIQLLGIGVGASVTIVVLDGLRERSEDLSWAEARFGLNSEVTRRIVSLAFTLWDGHERLPTCDNNYSVEVYRPYSRGLACTDDVSNFLRHLSKKCVRRHDMAMAGLVALTAADIIRIVKEASFVSVHHPVLVKQAAKLSTCRIDDPNTIDTAGVLRIILETLGMIRRWAPVGGDDSISCWERVGDLKTFIRDEKSRIGRLPSPN